jgi:phosphoglycolate phosphatase-like HAD superfamily hydrolase
MSRPLISLLITDLDNTVYDWLTAFVPAFYAMVHEAAPLIGVDEEALLDDLQAVHRKHGDSEHPFALLETRAVQKKFGEKSQKEIAQVLDPAFHAFNRLRKQNLKLYDGVYETLEQLSRLHIPVVAYTDARVINCLFRLDRLAVKHFFSCLYAPGHVAKEVDQSTLSGDFVRLLPPNDRKPNPQTLIDICSQYRVAPSDALYVGDSLVRDVYMARRAKLHAAWAKFGTLYDKSLWPQLVRVTHWTDADVKREKILKDEARGVEPDCVLYKFSDLFEHFEFNSIALPPRA